MTRTFNLQLLRSKLVFPVSKPNMHDRQTKTSKFARYCSSIVFIPCQYAHAHIIDGGTKRKQTKRVHNNGTRTTRAATPF